MEKYDLCVLGGGPAGYAAAMRAIDFGKKVMSSAMQYWQRKSHRSVTETRK